MERTPKETRRAVIYCRASKKDPSLYRQARDLGRWAELQGFEVVAVMNEELHGTSAQEEVLALAKSQKIEAILVTTDEVWLDFDGQWRKLGLRDLPTYLRRQKFIFDGLDHLARLQIPILSKTGVVFDWNTSKGQEWAQRVAEVVRRQADWKRALIWAGMNEARKKGRTIGRKEGPSRRTSKATPKILRLRAKGFSYRVIAEATGLDPKTVASVIKYKTN
jgi:DNA invertase Pin-like site-specific DNA recombinase